MLAAFPHAMPLEGLIGGLMIGVAAAVMLLGLGRIAGVSGLAARATGIADSGAPRGRIETRFPPSVISLVIGGLLVGYGTRLGSGCTSGHGVCGMSRLSPRSLIATAIFMASGFVTVALMRAGGLL